MTGPVADSSSISSLMPAVVFVNPTAGRGRALTALPRIRTVFEDESVPAEFITIQSHEELRASALAAIKGGARLLLALGGDGTLHELVNAAQGASVVFGVLPT